MPMTFKSTSAKMAHWLTPAPLRRRTPAPAGTAAGAADLPLQTNAQQAPAGAPQNTGAAAQEADLLQAPLPAGRRSADGSGRPAKTPSRLSVDAPAIAGPSSRHAQDAIVNGEPTSRYSEDADVNVGPSSRFSDTSSVNVGPTSRFSDYSSVPGGPSSHFSDTSSVNAGPSASLSGNAGVPASRGRRLPQSFSAHDGLLAQPRGTTDLRRTASAAAILSAAVGLGEFASATGRLADNFGALRQPRLVRPPSTETLEGPLPPLRSRWSESSFGSIIGAYAQTHRPDGAADGTGDAITEEAEEGPSAS